MAVSAHNTTRPFDHPAFAGSVAVPTPELTDETVAMLDRPPSRRGFLRGLVSLLLIGGSVALIGSPTQAVTSATDEQLALYAAFACDECQTVLKRLMVNGNFDRYRLPDVSRRYEHLFPAPQDIAMRAPVLLSAAGVPLT